MHVVLCLLVVVHCLHVKTEENEFEKTNFIVSDDSTPVEDEEEISSTVTDVSSALVTTEDRTNTEEDHRAKITNFSSNLWPNSTSESVPSSNFFTYSPHTSTEFEPTTEASCHNIPEIRSLTISNVNSFDVLLKWDPPANSDCVRNYVVYGNKKRQSTSDTELLIPNLNACQRYTVSVAVFNGTNVGKIKSVTFTTAVNFSYNMGPLGVTEYTQNLKVSWQRPPLSVRNCIKSYTITWKYNEVSHVRETSALYFIIPNIPCTQYVISVSPKGGRPRSRSYTTKSVLPKVEDFIITKVESFNVSLQWIPAKNNNCFRRYRVYVNNEEYQRTTNTELTVTNLNACQPYKIGVKVSNGSHIGEQSYEHVTTKTPDPFSYSVTNLKVEELNGNLVVSWEPPPLEVRHCVRSYYYQLEGDDDTINNTIEASQNNQVQVSKIACVQYDILVYPQVNDTDVIPQNLTYTTKEFPTNPPVIVQIEPYKTEALILWKIDDSSNKCKLSQLVVTCNATDDLNDDLPWIMRDRTVAVEINSTNVDMEIDGLSPFTNYTCLGIVTNKAGNSSGTEFAISTEEDVPSMPRIRVTDSDLHSFVIEWLEPETIPGLLTGYHLEIDSKGPGFQPLLEKCAHTRNMTVHETVDATQNTYVFKEALPCYIYEISVLGFNGAGNGAKATIEHITKTSSPDPVTNLKLNENPHSGEFYLTYDLPCNLNGPFKFIRICTVGRRDAPVERECITTNEVAPSVHLKPDYYYIIEVTVVNANFLSPTEIIRKQTDPAVPPLGVRLQRPTSNQTTKSYFKFFKDAFDDTNGKVLYYALKLSPKNVQGEDDSGSWDNATWPSDSITPARWNPFKNGVDEIVFVIGENESCSQHRCNKPLNEDTEYTLIVRGFTRATYRDTPPLNFKTLKPSKTGLILGLIFGFLIMLIVPIGLFLWKRGNTLRSTGDKLLVTIPAAISCAKFSSFYETVVENPNILKSQFAALSAQSKEVALETSYSILPENKRKNRYTNILPYDHTRVKLQIDEDDEISSDYINASYIKGYSGKVEYIATQGPLESTSKDFWKMIIQENVTMVVMVSQFVEQSKEKCYQYFPNNHEMVSFGESLDVRCSTELHFGTYCIRTLQVRKDTEQRNVLHIQYLEWPDFGVPQSTDNVLQLCYQMRERTSTEGGLTVVHCSAGVGRTGTLIALDILLQTIQRQKNLNIYKTVFKLRKQRINMVQTEKQYVFLHTCVRDYLQSPAIGQSNGQVLDHTYENMDILRSSLTKNLLEIESESTL